MNPLTALENYNPALGNAASWVVILGLVFALFRSIVVSAADRKRASTESKVADSEVSLDLIKILQGEIARLNERVAALETANQVKDSSISDLTAEKLALVAQMAAERLASAAALSAESLLKTAAIAEAAVLRARLTTDNPLVDATLEGARETGRVADAAELAVKGAGK